MSVPKSLWAKDIPEAVKGRHTRAHLAVSLNSSGVTSTDIDK